MMVLSSSQYIKVIQCYILAGEISNLLFNSKITTSELLLQEYPLISLIGNFLPNIMNSLGMQK